MAYRAEDIQDLVDCLQSVPALGEQFKEMNRKHIYAP